MAIANVPRRDVEALSTFITFAKGITAQPGLYMLTAQQASEIQSAVDGFAEAYAIASAPATRTMGAVRVKDDARVLAERMFRRYYALIKSNELVSDEDKIDICVRPINRSRARISVPQIAPAIAIIAAHYTSHTLVYRDSTNGDSLRKPFGASQLQLFVALGEKRAIDPREAKLCGCFTRNPVIVKFDHEDDGKVATYFARWVSQRGQFGPWSNATSMRVSA